MVTSRDVQDIVARLSSDKAKLREEGIRLLNSWLEGEKSMMFCKYLGEKTTELEANDIPNSDTWPFFISLLIRCVSLEISGSKRRLPKIIYAKAFRNVVQRAKDANFSGNTLFLLPVARALFNHMWDVLSNVPAFQAEYEIILRLLLAVRDYRFHLRSRIYCSFVLLYIEKVRLSLGEKSSTTIQSNPKEEVFRTILTLHSLLENPAGEFSPDIRNAIVMGFVKIFSHLREEGKIARKIMECINTYLLKDGLNLGDQSIEIFNSTRQFVFRYWLTTHDRALKDVLICYAMLQLNLIRGASGENSLVDHLFDVVRKDLDCSSPSVFRVDAAKDDKLGTLGDSECGLVELAAQILYRACASSAKAPSTVKRAKRENAAVLVKEALAEGRWLWHATLCCLIRKYHTRMGNDVLVSWFDGISTNFERIMSEANMTHKYDGFLWTLRSLQQISAIMPASDSQTERLSAFRQNEVGCNWQSIWRYLFQGLPIFSNITSVADAVLVLLGNMMSSDLLLVYFVPRDIWELKLFKSKPSMSFFYFIIQFFSQKHSQDDLQDNLHVRRNLCKVILNHLKLKELPLSNEHMVVMLPAAIFALSTGAVPFIYDFYGYFQLQYSINTVNTSTNWLMADEYEHDNLSKLLECPVEVLAEIDFKSGDEILNSQVHRRTHFPRQLRDELLHEMEIFIVEGLFNEEAGKGSLSDIFFYCALTSNFLYGSLIARESKQFSPFVTKLGQYLLELMAQSEILLRESSFEKQLLFSGFSSDPLAKSASLASLRCFLSCPIFAQKRDFNMVPYDAVVESTGRILKAFADLYVEPSHEGRNFSGEPTSTTTFVPDAPPKEFGETDYHANRILDLELDVNEDSEDLNILNVVGKITAGISFAVSWKLGIIAHIACFFSVLDKITWEIIFEIWNEESEQKVHEAVLYSLCQHLYWSSASKLQGLVKQLKKMLDKKVASKLDCACILVAINHMLGSLQSWNVSKWEAGSTFEDDLQQVFAYLGDLVISVAEYGLLDLVGRTKLIDCICNFILFKPQLGQIMIDQLFLLLRDPSYRVRFFLAHRIGVLFQTWEGHDELFQDVCSNFGVLLVSPLKGKPVMASDVLSAGPQPQPALETIIITLMHLAYHSEMIELEAVFMICVICAIDARHRELANIVFNNLSSKLHYATRFKYLEELLGPILFYWVSCGVSLVALVEIRQLFLSDCEPSVFIQYCCPWLLPGLVLLGDTYNLNWLSMVVSQPLPVLLKNYFVPMFSVCISLYCSERSEKERAATVLQSLLFQLAEISEVERDNIIKKNMVSIVSHILSLSSCASEPALPFFSRDTVSCAVRTVVDGFVEMETVQENVAVIDKINIFRADRVFMLIVEMHYRISSAIHHRHRCHRLASVEVLIAVLGHSTAISSTFSYLFNLVEQSIDCHSLQDQCCRLVSALLDTYRCNPSSECTTVLGEQLQCLVPKLVALWTSGKICVERSQSKSSQVLSLLHKLIVECDPLLYDYITELEPFPEKDVFDVLRSFCQGLSHAYSPWEHLLKLGKRSCYLPPRLLTSSVQALHKKLIMGDVFQTKWAVTDVEGRNRKEDPGIVEAVWALVRMSAHGDANSVRHLVSDFVSMVGIVNPHCVVFGKPGDVSPVKAHWCSTSESPAGMTFFPEIIMPEQLLVSLLKLLNKSMLNDSVRTIDTTLQALRGILSTERGQQTISSLDPCERSLIDIHAKGGINAELVNTFLLDLQQKHKADSFSLEDSSLWDTHNKTFQMWICPLVYSLIYHCTDVTLRLCQDVVMVNAEVAELLLPSVMVDISASNIIDLDVCKIISFQVQEHIFEESNQLIKSIQVFLNVLNELRLCYVGKKSSASSNQRNVKIKASSSGLKSRSTPGSSRDAINKSGALAGETFSWSKVYWLGIDYLIVAKSAISCGSYFTSVMYVEHWCEEHFTNLTLGIPHFSNLELPKHIEILISAVIQINEPDSIYGIMQSHNLTSQAVTFEHEGNWSKALEYYDLQVRSEMQSDHFTNSSAWNAQLHNQPSSVISPKDDIQQKKPYKGLIRSLQKIGCTHVLDLYFQGLTSTNKGQMCDLELAELQYEAAWRVGNWDFFLACEDKNFSSYNVKHDRFNKNLHSCLKELLDGDLDEFQKMMLVSKQELLWSVACASEESTEYIYSTIVKLQILYHTGIAWHMRWLTPSHEGKESNSKQHSHVDPIIPNMEQLSLLNTNWYSILEGTQLQMNFLEPLIAFRHILLKILGCNDSTIENLLQSASFLRKGCRFSQAVAALCEFNFLCVSTGKQFSSLYWLGRLEEAKLLRSRCQNEMAIGLAKYISENCQLMEEAAHANRLVGKWLAETGSSNSRTILEKYLKPAVSFAESCCTATKKSIEKQSQSHFCLAHYADGLFRSYKERLNSNEWKAAMSLRKHKTFELEALVRRLKSSKKSEKIDFQLKIQELQKQLAIDKDEAQKMEDDRDNFLKLALEGYKRCLIISERHDLRVVFRLIALWFSLSSRQIVIDNMISAIDEVQSYKFVPLVYQIASRMGCIKDDLGPHTFQFALASLVKKMAIDHPYHTLFQILALANGDRIKDKQRNRNSFVVDMDKMVAAKNLIDELQSYHGAILQQMKQMVDIYIKLAELETKREDANKRVNLPREIRSVRQLELVPVVTAGIQVDHDCLYHEGSFPYFSGLADSIIIMNGINAPKVVECLGSDGKTYRQLAKSGNDDLRQDAVMEQFFGLVNTFLQSNRDTWRRKLSMRTYKVVPFTPSAGVLEWVNGTLPLGEYLIGSARNGGAHNCYGMGDWSFLKCREHMSNEKDKRKAFNEVCDNFRPVMHHFFLERFFQPPDWFEKRLAYTRSLAASSMVGYIVGLGDRHSMNILIDQETAEVVHIDLGVAFEQGMMLKTPERVPFRLTRDIIDGMGITGVEGVFRRCCEETVSVMRTNKEALLTIVEVFIHDPLYKWALSPLKALQRQKELDDDLEMSIGDSQEAFQGNKDATRALMRVKQKLDGYEEGELRSVHGQVHQLIQDAIDPERLCQMFPGWGAWL